MTVGSRLKKVLLATAVVAAVVGIYLVYSLAGLGASPVVFADPPSLVAQYAAQMEHSDPSSESVDQGPEVGAAVDAEPVNESASGNLTTDIEAEKELVHRVIFDGEPLDLILSQFAHPEKAKRVKMAAAFGAVNIEFTHNEESGYPDLRRQFWVDVEDHLPNIENALFEALIASAEEGANSRLPYTIAWLPGQDRDAVEVLAWAAKHHPDPWVRRFSVYFVVRFGGHEDLSVPILKDRINDPSYIVRREVLDRKIERLVLAVRGGDDRGS